MKFKLVEKHSNIDESINTNLRKFLLSLVELAGIDLGMPNPVVHHTKKNRDMNKIDDLVLMDDHDHRSMHAKYRNKSWDIDAHKLYRFIEVKELLSRAVYNLQKLSHREEKLLEDESKKVS